MVDKAYATVVTFTYAAITLALLKAGDATLLARYAAARYSVITLAVTATG